MRAMLERELFFEGLRAARAGQVANRPSREVAGSALVSAWPSPFNPSTTVSYTVGTPGSIRLAVYNTAGQLVRTLVSGDVQAGEHTAVWNGTDGSGRAASGGVYIVRLTTSTDAASQRVTLLR